MSLYQRNFTAAIQMSGLLLQGGRFAQTTYWGRPTLVLLKRQFVSAYVKSVTAGMLSGVAQQGGRFAQAPTSEG